MIRDQDISEISDGRFYTLKDMVKVGCNDCRGCSDCCHGMGNSIILDPLDIRNLSRAVGKSFEEMTGREIELHLTDGMVLPSLSLSGPQDSCIFLDEKGRCSIHALRPGICRLFPLGRYYHDGTFSYILQKGECHARGRYKVKVRQWLDVPDPEAYEAFVLAWHDLIRFVPRRLAAMDPETRKDAVLYILRLFYSVKYEADTDFYEQFRIRLRTAYSYLA